jgi:hypothetical protein
MNAVTQHLPVVEATRDKDVRAATRPLEERRDRFLGFGFR